MDLKVIYKSYVAKWTAILTIIGMVGTTAGWVSGGKDWINRKIDNYTQIQRQTIIENVDSLLVVSMERERRTYNGLLMSNMDELELTKVQIDQLNSMLKMVTDAILGQLERVEFTNFDLWLSNSGSYYYETGGKIYRARFESNRKRWIYVDYNGIAHICK